jgi:O-antigen/teichoic acid export membrane protein
MNLKSGISITLIANIVFAISQWIIIAGLNYSGSTYIVGQYAYALALAGVFLTIGQLGLRPYLLSSKISTAELDKIFHTRCISSFIAFISLFIYVLIVVEEKYWLLIIVLGIVKVVENISDICHGYFQRNFQILLIAKSRILRSLISPVLFIGIYISTQSVVYASLGMFISLLITFVLIDRGALVEQNISLFKINKLTSYFKIINSSMPMGVATVLVILVVNIPLFTLKSYYSDQVVGIYASIFYFVVAGSLILQSVMQVLSPTISHNIKNHQSKVVKSLIFKGYVLASVLGLLGVAVAIFFGEFVLELLYGKAFGNQLNLLIAAALLNWVLAYQAIGGVSLTSFGSFKFQMKTMLFVLPICWLGSLALVSKYSAQGAMFAGILSSFVISVLFLIKLIKEVKVIEKN